MIALEKQTAESLKDRALFSKKGRKAKQPQKSYTDKDHAYGKNDHVGDKAAGSKKS